uniref:Uncharacterized protein n=1 Tax=Mesocestoides corti TaxID=53468 RepID=A0A5K3ERT5_MESCO
MVIDAKTKPSEGYKASRPLNCFMVRRGYGISATSDLSIILFQGRPLLHNSLT